MSFPAMSLGRRFCVSRKGGTGGGGWVYPKGANSMAASGLVLRSPLVGTGRAISIYFGINGVTNKRSHLVGPPFSEFKAIKITNEYKIWVERGFIFLNSCFKTRWIVEGELYNVQRQKQLLLPLCCGNSLLSRPINMTLYDKAPLMCKNTPPPCLFLFNLRRQLLEIVWSSYLSILGGKVEKNHHF